MRVRRARTSCETSLTILALSLGASVVNHLARRWGCELVWHQPAAAVVAATSAAAAPPPPSQRGDTHHFALPREQDEVSTWMVSTGGAGSGRVRGSLDGHGLVGGAKSQVVSSSPPRVHLAASPRRRLSPSARRIAAPAPPRCPASIYLHITSQQAHGSIQSLQNSSSAGLHPPAVVLGPENFVRNCTRRLIHHAR